MIFFLAMFVFEGLGMMAAALPLMLRRVKPNNTYGFRIPKTLNDEATWYRVNELFGRWFFGAAAVFVLAAIGLWFVPGIGHSIVAYNMACTGFLFAGLTVAGVKGYGAI